jgi:pimeloyl-ACP methyl ester carboxylesterase
MNELRRLVGYWADGYDWRAEEAAINALPSHVAEIDGTPVHYLRFDGERRDALPIVVTNGWPSSFLELAELARRLAYPSQFGADTGQSFTVIVPSLPGFAFSPQRPNLPPSVPTHELWHRLMHDELGFTRYAAHGSDLGAGTTSLLGQAHAPSVAGIHLLAVAGPAPGSYDASTLTGEEQEYLDSVAAWSAEEGAYQHQLRPVGLTRRTAGLDP